MKMSENKGLIHIYCGDGKGKTTAAVGLSVRCAGAGIPVVFTQFMKDGTSSELSILRQLPGVHVLCVEEHFGFTWTLTEEQKKRANIVYTELFLRAAKLLDQIIQNENIEYKKSNHPKVLFVLDEIMAAYNYHMIDQNIVLQWIKQRKNEIEVVMTGREPKDELLRLADYITEMKKRAHVYEQGVNARQGIEW